MSNFDRIGLMEFVIDEVIMGDFFSQFFGVHLSVSFNIHNHIHLSVGDAIQPCIFKASLN